MKKLEKFAPHLYAIFGFIVIALIYFYPVLSGKQLAQSDIAQYTGMAKEQIDFRNEYHEEPYWTNSGFGGMPTYQLGAKYPHNYIKSLDSVLRFLPRPADYLFLYFIGFYLLMLSLRVKPLKAFFGALAFGFSTYLIIILGVGHNAKAHAIAYIPVLLAGIIYVFSKRYLIGGIITVLAAGLELQANHFQMTYYFLFLIAFIALYYVIEIIKEKDFQHLYKSLGILAFAAILGVGMNATNLMATSEYAKNSTRSTTDLTFTPEGKKKTDNNAMSYDYITEYSYGVAESLNLIAPKLFGGSNTEDLGEKSSMYQFIISQNVPEQDARDLVKHMPTYWGDQPIVAAPAYIGIVVFFLAILALFLEKRKIKYALVIGVVFSLLLSFGKNFSPLTDFFINYVPLYNKFRAVSSIQVILELCMPVLAILGLSAFINADEESRKKPLLISAGIVAGILILLILGNGAFDFTSGNDKIYAQQYGPEFMKVLREDRESLYFSTLYRSFGFLAVAFGLMFLFTKKVFSQFTTVILIGLVMVLDLFVVAKNYVKAEDFVSKSQIERPFGEPTEADARILEDTTHFRVFEIDGNMNSARASYFHQSIGGYNAVKPRKYQELFDYQIANNNIEILNMLNTKYIIKSDQEGRPQALENPEANGNAWFVSKVKVVNSADEEMKALNTLKTKEEATFLKPELSKGLFNFETGKDSTSTIELISYKPNHLKYVSNNSKNGFGVFSEMYYKDGWKATIDGKDAEIYNVDYVLRGLNIPAGKHTIEFKFEPEVIKTGSMIALTSTVLVFLIIVFSIYYWRKQNKKLAELK
ncbi:YfhO family protein [Flavobacterium urocaniciphilum]|uniref:Membrane protein YfhO n=1 Tax=Flavobacterium urocaniciphilum TaxID=1299341 RepID=A0A1H9CZC4_9FLAO|nr:YfhO family protein [Flavobacterium urocaniciphilum]SEQ06560.1 membrane protein YfhO [Flavobacterium urocaniciphilum]